MCEIADYKANDLTMSGWCTANYITKNQLKYWLRKAERNEAPSSALSTPSTLFVTLTVDDPSAQTFSMSSLVVRFG
ncbi:IS66 family insertion sequence element accessory protein TnpA [Cohnella laeviribosi]|uniref:IS66 family insertion sequence element accessory protein TnpA n=1 Tax=Cohnella laeviribosi TaxID=380174 RepID=UPI003CCB8195